MTLIVLVAAALAVVPHESDDPEIVRFARVASDGADSPLAAAEAIFEAMRALIDARRILRDPDNVPKSRLPRTGVEVLRAALDENAPPLDAGCYELTSAFIAATHAVSIPTFGMDAKRSVGQIGHIVAGLDTGGGRPMIFDLQNGVRRRDDAYRRLSPRELAAHHHNHLAVAYVLRGDPDAALRAVDDAIALGGWVPSFLNNRAAALRALGSPWSARAELAHAIAGAPGNATFRYQWGLVELDLGRPTEAVGALRSALSLDGSLAHARRDLGLAQFAAGDLEAGERTLRELLGAGAAPEHTREILVAGLLARGARELAGQELRAVRDPVARRELERWRASGTTEAGSRIDRLRRMLEGPAR